MTISESSSSNFSNLLGIFTNAESKVKAATAAGGTTAGIITLAMYFLSKAHWVQTMPDATKASLATVVGLVVTGISTFIAGHIAPHTSRPELAPVVAPAVVSPVAPDASVSEVPTPGK